MQKLARARYSPLQEVGGLCCNGHPFVALAGAVLVFQGRKTL